MAGITEYVPQGTYLYKSYPSKGEIANLYIMVGHQTFSDEDEPIALYHGYPLTIVRLVQMQETLVSGGDYVCRGMYADSDWSNMKRSRKYKDGGFKEVIIEEYFYWSYDDAIKTIDSLAKQFCPHNWKMISD